MRITESQLRRVVKKMIAEQIALPDPVTYLAELLYDNNEGLPSYMITKIFWGMEDETGNKQPGIKDVEDFIKQKGGVQGFLDWMKGHVTANQHAMFLSKLRNLGRSRGGDIRGTPGTYNPFR